MVKMVLEKEGGLGRVKGKSSRKFESYPGEEATIILKAIHKWKEASGGNCHDAKKHGAISFLKLKRHETHNRELPQGGIPRERSLRGTGSMWGRGVHLLRRAQNYWGSRGGMDRGENDRVF